MEIQNEQPTQRWPQRLLESLRVYRDRRVLAVLALGFASGLPLLLTLSTLSAWLAEAGVSRTAIGLFALVGTPYAFKFAWAPLVDKLPIPWLTRRLGRRRGWILLSQLMLAASLVGLGLSHPAEAPLLAGAFAFLVAIWSATQDIVIDAFRVELLDEDQQAAGAAAIVFGYRIGMLVAGAGALVLSTVVPWSAVYAIMASCLLVGAVTALLSPEPEHTEASEERPQQQSFTVWLKSAVVEPLGEFLTRKHALYLLALVAVFKLGDALVGVMAMPFYIDLGFSMGEIAGVSKVFGLGATLVGAFAGGALVARTGVLRGLLVCGVLQLASNLMFAVLAASGHSLSVLTLTIAVENVAGGMGTAAFVAFLSGLCNARYTATQYALLSSLAALGRSVLAAPGGWLAEQLAWGPFFVLTAVAAVPGLLLLLGWMRRHAGGDRDSRSTPCIESEPRKETAPEGSGRLSAITSPG